MRTQSKLIVATMCAVLGVAGIAGCAPKANESATANEQSQAQAEEATEYTDEQKAIIAGEEGATYDDISLDAYPGKDYLDGLHEMWDSKAEEYVPEIRTLPDGQMVQRTPSELVERARQGMTPYNISTTTTADATAAMPTSTRCSRTSRRPCIPRRTARSSTPK